MNKQTNILISLLFLQIGVFAQDTSKLPGINPDKNSSIINSGGPDSSGNASISPGAHATINTNTGTIAPVTTSGTLNSSANPNTQVVIPIGKGKKKSTTPITHNPGTVAPDKN